MPIPTPRQVFDDPTNTWTFLTLNSDTDFEGQHFDRKEAGRAGADAHRLSKQLREVRDGITETISAFANSNVEGGLLVVGIASDGGVSGIDHLSEEQLNSLTDFPSFLHHQAAEAKLYQCKDVVGNDKTICLVFIPYADNGICETPGRRPKAWSRSGPQNILMTREVCDRLRVTKGLVEFERAFCCPFNVEDVPEDVLAEFRNVFHPDSTREFTDERVLYEAGAIVRRDEAYWFTHAGLLFFGSNPQRKKERGQVLLFTFNTRLR